MELTFGHQLFQLVGAMLILVAYAAHQLGKMDPGKPLYNIANGIGSAILGFYAVWPRINAGFMVLEIAWVVISIFALRRALRRENAIQHA